MILGCPLIRTVSSSSVWCVLSRRAEIREEKKVVRHVVECHVSISIVRHRFIMPCYTHTHPYLVDIKARTTGYPCTPLSTMAACGARRGGFIINVRASSWRKGRRWRHFSPHRRATLLFVRVCQVDTNRHFGILSLTIYHLSRSLSLSFLKWRRGVEGERKREPAENGFLDVTHAGKMLGLWYLMDHCMTNQGKEEGKRRGDDLSHPSI